MLTDKLKSTLKGYLDFPKKGILFQDISPVLLEPSLFNDLIRKMSEFNGFDKAECIVAIDARGFIFGSAISFLIKKPLIMARKKHKLPGELVSKQYGLEYGEDSLSLQEESLNKFNSFILVDDLLATGGTAKCIYEMLESKNKKIVGLSVFIELESLLGRDKLPFDVSSQIKLD